METPNRNASPDLSNVQPGEMMDENPDDLMRDTDTEQLLDNDPEFQDWNADHKETDKAVIANDSALFNFLSGLCPDGDTEELRKAMKALESE